RTQKNGRLRPSASSAPTKAIKARSSIVAAASARALRPLSEPRARQFGPRVLDVQLVAEQQAPERDQDQPVCQRKGKKIDQAQSSRRRSGCLIAGRLTRR